MKVQLFSDYGSRGGTIAVATDSVDAARRTIASWGISEGEYLGSFHLEGDFPPIEKGGIELEASYGGPGFVLIPDRGSSSRAGGFPVLDGVIYLRYISAETAAGMNSKGEPNVVPKGWIHPRWDDDAFGFFLMGVGTK